MRVSALATLKQGTIVLLRPFGPGAREIDAKDNLVLAALGPNTPLIRLGLGSYSGIPDWVPEGYIPHMEGTYRSIHLVSELSYQAEDDDPDSWEDLTRHTAVMARNIIGPWEQVRDEVLSARRERIASKVRDREQAALERQQAQREFERALAVLRPGMEATGMGDHRALTECARPGARYFTVEEVARLISAMGEKGQEMGGP